MRFSLFAILGALLMVDSAVYAADPDWPTTIQGYGLKVELAKKDAVHEAARQLVEYMRSLDPPLVEWQPTEEFVEKYLIDGAGFGKGEKIGGIDTQSWTFKLKTPNVRQLAKLDRQALGLRLQHERQMVAEERMKLAGWILSVVLALLALATMYIRVKELVSNSRRPHTVTGIKDQLVAAKK